MFRSRKSSLAAVFTTAFMLIISSAWAATTAEPKIGVVDVQRVMAEAPRMKQLSEELKALDTSLTAKLNLRAQNLMLSEEEIKELTNLKSKPKPTDADTKRIKALNDIERSKDNTLKQLQETKNLNAEQNKQMKELQDIQRKSQEIGRALSKDYYSTLQNKGLELQNKADSEMIAVIAKVTEAKGLTLVISKQVALPDGTAMNTILLGGVDITDDVINKLDRQLQ